MTKLLLIVTVLLASQAAYPQSWLGYHSGNYAGLHSLAYQPASIAGNPYKLEVNLFSTNINALGRGFFPSVSFFRRITSAGFSGYNDLLGLGAEKALMNGSVMMPSMLYSIDDKSAFGFHWTVRGLISHKVSNVLLSDIFSQQIALDTFGITLLGELLQSYYQNWAEYNFSYARVLMEREQHELSGGLTFKFLQGIAHGALELYVIQMQIADEQTLTNVQSDFMLNYNEGLEDLLSGNYFRLKGDPGIAFDVGFEYKRKESKPDQARPYKYKLGFSLLDMGFLSNKNSSGSGHVTITADTLRIASITQAPTLSAFLDTLNSEFEFNVVPLEDKRQTLPMSLVVSYDMPLGKNFYVHANTFFTFAGSSALFATSQNLYRITATPRYETKNAGVYLPVTYDNHNYLNAGLALRWKPLIIGSGNLLTRYFYREREMTGDFYFIIKVPILAQRKSPVKMRKGN